MKTSNKDGTPREVGSGRRKGANSFANVTLADLEQFCGSATLIPISRVSVSYTHLRAHET